jgi:hypothetical protein
MPVGEALYAEGRSSFPVETVHTRMELMETVSL